MIETPPPIQEHLDKLKSKNIYVIFTILQLQIEVIHKTSQLLDCEVWTGNWKDALYEASVSRMELAEAINANTGGSEQIDFFAIINQIDEGFQSAVSSIRDFAKSLLGNLGSTSVAIYSYMIREGYFPDWSFIGEYREYFGDIPAESITHDQLDFHINRNNTRTISPEETWAEMRPILHVPENIFGSVFSTVLDGLPLTLPPHIYLRLADDLIYAVLCARQNHK